MQPKLGISRRQFVAGTAGASLLTLAGTAAGKQKESHVPIGLELFSVRDELKKDPFATVTAIGKMGYECVEFFAPYYEWTPEYAGQIRKALDDSGLHCYSTHNGMQSFSPEGVKKAIELNRILGTHYIVLASTGRELTTSEEWHKVADTLDSANDTMKSAGLHAGYHNHAAEWKPVNGEKPMQILADNTDKSIMLQLDVGTCVEAGDDPVAWIESHPGRIRSLHLKDWSPDKGYKVLFGEGAVPWKNVLAAAVDKGGAEFFLIEQEGSRFPEMETADRCLVAYRSLAGNPSGK